MVTDQHKTTMGQQEVFNSSFDPTFGVFVAELLGYDSSNNVLRRIIVDASGIIQVSP